LNSDANEVYAEALLADGFEGAYLGFGYRFSYVVAIYNRPKCIEILTKEMSEEEANEHFDFNVVGSYVGEHTPIFLDPETRGLYRPEKERGDADTQEKDSWRKDNHQEVQNSRFSEDSQAQNRRDADLSQKRLLTRMKELIVFLDDVPEVPGNSRKFPEVPGTSTGLQEFPEISGKFPLN